MAQVVKAIETTGIVDAHRRLLLDDSLPVADKSRVRVIVLITADYETTPLSHESLESLTPNMRLAAAFSGYQRNEISQEKAAELAGLSRRDFLMALAREKREVFAVDFDDLKKELARG
jgi:predicted HTH domain antitoxin